MTLHVPSCRGSLGHVEEITEWERVTEAALRDRDFFLGGGKVDRHLERGALREAAPVSSPRKI